MLFTKVAPVGVDVPIQKLQTYLHGKLIALWGLSDSQYNAYGRCYRNQKKGGYVAEVYKGSNEYQEVYLDDKIPVLSFFGLTDSQIQVKVGNIVEVHLIFFVNIPKIKNVVHRGDEEVRRDVQNLVNVSTYGFELTSVQLGIDRVFAEYGGTIQAARENLDPLKGRDMHPFHCFRLDFSLNYNINNC